MRWAYDSTNPADIPLTARMVAYYVDGLYRVPESVVRARFPSAVLIPISALGTNAGTVGDVETGDMMPWEAPGWVLMRRAAGVDPTIYINWSNWNPTRTEFQRRGIPEPHYWLASYDGVPEIPAGTVAKQYANAAITGGHFDLSAVADYWPGVDPYNPTASAPSEVRAPQEELMTNSALTAMFRLCYAVFEHRTVEDGNLTYDEIKDHVSRVNADQTNLDEEIQHFIDGSKAGGNYKLTVAGPAGPKGDPGQPAPAADLSKLSPKGHTHLVEPDV